MWQHHLILGFGPSKACIVSVEEGGEERRDEWFMNRLI